MIHGLLAAARLAIRLAVQQTFHPVRLASKRFPGLLALTEHSRLMSGPPLMRGLVIHNNIPVLAVDKLFLVNPRAITGPHKMDLLFDVKSTPALIIRPRLIHVVYMHDLCMYRHTHKKILTWNLLESHGICL